MVVVALVIYFIFKFGKLFSDLRTFTCIYVAFIRYFQCFVFYIKPENNVLGVSVEWRMVNKLQI